jgi:hypothetical protein
MAGFLLILSFPLSVLIPLNAPFLSSSGTDTMGHFRPKYSGTQFALRPKNTKSTVEEFCLLGYDAV